MAVSSRSRTKTIGLWAFKSIIALAFLLFGTLKLMGMPMLVHDFDVIGLGQNFRILTGLIEVGGAVLLLVPLASRYAILALFGVSVGSFVAQATRLHGDIVHTVVLILLTALLGRLIWRQRSTVRRIQA